jgi:cation diffusion facilitator CzcD-associated flavoprotein CzcO
MYGAMNGHTPAPSNDCFDVIIIGAGISGINAGYRIQSQHPDLTYAILDARSALGGTWDLFRYPGIRSDSDLFTFGFSWHPWNQPEPIAEAHAITKYLRETAAEYGIDSHILFQHRVVSADWSSADSAWTVNADNQGNAKSLKARFIVLGTGYYDYHNPLDVVIPGLENFKGDVVHPQFWPENLDYSGKKVIVIGSGATAITLVPSMAQKASLVTMLQRSPSYILSVPNGGRTLLSYILPKSIATRVLRLKWLLQSRVFLLFCRKFPGLSRKLLRMSVQAQLPKNIPHDPHFQPRYDPWDQRMCICPNGDFFKSLRSGRADVKTDNIKTVTETGISLQSGEHIDADVIVTATGLKLQIAGGARLTVDGKEVRIPDKYMWNGVMLQDIPNLAYVVGYTNASWTLGADATALFVCRLLREMKARGLVAVIPRMDDDTNLKPRKFLDLNSTYITAAEKNLPKVADRAPWQPRYEYLWDVWFAQYGRIDKCLETVKGPSVKLQEKKDQ